MSPTVQIKELRGRTVEILANCEIRPLHSFREKEEPSSQAAEPLQTPFPAPQLHSPQKPMLGERVLSQRPDGKQSTVLKCLKSSQGKKRPAFSARTRDKRRSGVFPLKTHTHIK